MSHRPTLDFVLGKSARNLDEKSRSETILNPALYQLSSANGTSDKLFLCEIVAVGEGRTVRGASEVFAVEPGETALLLENKISYRLQIRGVKHYLIRNSAIAGAMHPETFAVKPTNHYVLVKPNEARAVAFESRGPIWIPTDQCATDDEKDDPRLRRTGIVAAYGEVVDVGPGRWDEGEWKQPTCRKGDLVFYDASHSTLTFHARGEPRTLVPCDQIGLIEPE